MLSKQGLAHFACDILSKNKEGF